LLGAQQLCRVGIRRDSSGFVSPFIVPLPVGKRVGVAASATRIHAAWRRNR
jgi:hypothetical protein